MEHIQKLYCSKCGSKLQTVECDYYDPYTGKKVTADVCVKVGCYKSCEFFGHDWKWRFILPAKCRKCGDEDLGYGY